MGRFGLYRTGSTSYRQYLRSSSWAFRRVRWFRECRAAGVEPACQVCQVRLDEAGTLDLHHLSYAGVSREDGQWRAREKHEELMPLCREHHQRLHEIMDGRKEFFGWDRTRASVVIVARLFRQRQARQKR